MQYGAAIGLGGNGEYGSDEIYDCDSPGSHYTTIQSVICADTEFDLSTVQGPRTYD